MKFLVTGGGGFIGSSLVKQLLANSHSVDVLTRGVTPLQRLAGLPVAIRRVELHDPAQVRSVLEETRPDAIAHLAWHADPGDYLSSPLNVDALTTSVALIRCAVALGIPKIVCAGTCLEYVDIPRLRTELDQLDPRSVYASCKHAFHLIARALAAGSGTHVVWARVFHLHGPGEHPSRLIPWVASQLRRGASVELTDGSQMRDHLHVDDVASGLMTLLTTAASGSYNVSSGQPVSLRAVLEIVANYYGRRELLRFGARPHRPGEVMYLAGQSERLRSLGWAPKWALDAGLKASLAS